MFSYILTFGEAITHKPAHPERTARRVAANGDDYEFRVWPSRGAMLTTVEMQSKSAPSRRNWIPVVGR